jgi:nicotinate-nucleotide adenylyltransferase
MSSIAANAFGAHRIPEMEAAILPSLNPPAWTFLTAPLSDLSSTAIRAGRSG